MLVIPYTTRPLDGRQRRDYRPQYSPFSASWGSTRSLLDRELRELGARQVVMQVDCSEWDLRQDGELRANARPFASPTVVLSFETRDLGPMRYECGRFTKWQDNVRAIALGLEALRKVDRYGIAGRGEQYRGWQALPPATAMGAPLTQQEAFTIIADLAGVDVSTLDIGNSIKQAYRLAASIHHPDKGGDPALFATLQRAWEALTA